MVIGIGWIVRLKRGFTVRRAGRLVGRDRGLQCGAALAAATSALRIASTSSCSGKVNSSIHRISGALRPVSTCSVRTMRQTCTPITTDGVLMLSSLGMQDSTDKQASEAYAQDLPTDTVPDVYPCSRESLCVAEVEYNLLSQSSVGPQRCAMHPVHTLDMHTSCPLIVTSRRPALIV
jgi:hypothetical protein